MRIKKISTPGKEDLSSLESETNSTFVGGAEYLVQSDICAFPFISFPGIPHWAKSPFLCKKLDLTKKLEKLIYIFVPKLTIFSGKKLKFCA